MFEWITTADVRAAIGIDPAAPVDHEWLTTCTDAVNAYVNRKRPDLPGVGYGTDAAELADVRTGAVLLAVSMYQRRGGDMQYDPYALPARMVDANVRALLGLDRPVIA